MVPCRFGPKYCITMLMTSRLSSMIATSSRASAAANRRSRRVTEAYRRIRTLILSDRFPGGAPIVELRSARELGFTRPVIRSALDRLRHEGYVRDETLGTYHRAVVVPLDVDDMDDL